MSGQSKFVADHTLDTVSSYREPIPFLWNNDAQTGLIRFRPSTADTHVAFLAYETTVAENFCILLSVQ